MRSAGKQLQCTGRMDLASGPWEIVGGPREICLGGWFKIGSIQRAPPRRNNLEHLKAQRCLWWS